MFSRKSDEQKLAEYVVFGKDFASVTYMLLVLFFEIFTLVSTACTNAQGAELSGWNLKQGGDIIGERNLFLRADAVRVDSPKSGYSIVSKAPEWKVTIFNRLSKKIVEMPNSAFRGDTTSKLYSGDRSALSNGQWSKTSKISKYGKYELRTFTMTSTKRSMTEGNRITDAHLSLLKDASIDPKAFQILRMIYQLPMIQGVPVDVSFFDLEDKFTVHPLRTYWIEKGPIADKEFDLPKGFTRTKDIMEVYVDPVSHATYESFANWLDTEPKKKNKK